MPKTDLLVFEFRTADRAVHVESWRVWELPSRQDLLSTLERALKDSELEFQVLRAPPASEFLQIVLVPVAVAMDPSLGVQRDAALWVLKLICKTVVERVVASLRLPLFSRRDVNERAGAAALRLAAPRGGRLLPVAEAIRSGHVYVYRYEVHPLDPSAHGLMGHVEVTVDLDRSGPPTARWEP